MTTTTTTTAAALKVHALRTELDAIEANPLVDRAYFVPSQPVGVLRCHAAKGWVDRT